MEREQGGSTGDDDILQDIIQVVNKTYFEHKEQREEKRQKVNVERNMQGMCTPIRTADN